MKLFEKSILGGLSIAIASCIYLQFNGIVGAFLFSIGLFLILNMGFKLFTGTVGYIKSKEDVRDNLVILIGNIIGTCGSLVLPIGSAGPVVAAKLSAPLPITFVEGIICGIFIYSSVACYRKGKDYMVPICVAGFILCGAEHCIADLCYILMANALSFESVLFLLVVATGNAIGALLIDRI